MSARIYILSLIAVLFISCSKDPTKNLSSPDGKIVLQFILHDGQPQYAVSFGDEKLILPSSLGLRFEDNPDWLTGLRLHKVTERSSDTSWAPVWGTDSLIRDHFNELQIELNRGNPRQKLLLIFRAYNDGIAFRYLMPAQPGLDEFQLSSEETAFRFSDNLSAWWIPQDFESYEHTYRHTPVSQIKAVNTPLTLQSKKGTVISIHEAALTDYAAMTLAKDEDDSLQLNCALVPWPDGIKVKGETSFRSPWRTIMIADNAARLPESHLIENLNEPNKIDDISWIKPMKYVGIWWGMHINKYTWHRGPFHGATTAHAKKYVDFASAHHIPGLLIEGWNVGWESWLSGKNVQNYTLPYKDFDLRYVVDYARSKGVNIIGHHESGGNVPQYESQMKAAFAFYKNLGIHAVKTGYAGKMYPQGQHHHGQWMVRHYRRVVEEAARNQIMLDAHEPIKPTGIRRTWPNMMTREGVRGMEYNAWSEGNPPEHTTILPFTRMLAGPLDYTPGIFNLKFDPKGKHRVYTTLAKQLALYVVLYSPLQMAADLPENYENRPAFKFIEDVPVNWDETRALSCKIGDYVSLARRSGKDWYLGVITDEHPRKLSLALSFLAKGKTYLATIYRDGPETDYDFNPQAIEIASVVVTQKDTLTARMVKSGGMAVQFIPESE